MMFNREHFCSNPKCEKHTKMVGWVSATEAAPLTNYGGALGIRYLIYREHEGLEYTAFLCETCYTALSLNQFMVPKDDVLNSYENEPACCNPNCIGYKHGVHPSEKQFYYHVIPSLSVKNFSESKLHDPKYVTTIHALRWRYYREFYDATTGIHLVKTACLCGVCSEAYNTFGEQE